MNLAEQLPALALELHQLQLRDRRKVGRRGVDLDARQQAAKLEVLDARRLLHDVLARQVVAAGLQHMHEALRDGIGVHHRPIGAVGFGVIFIQELVPGLHARIVLPLRSVGSLR